MIKSLTINFETNKAAQDFAVHWGRATLTGNCQSNVKEDGSRDVTVYDVCKEKCDWINVYLNMNIQEVKTELSDAKILEELGL